MLALITRLFIALRLLKPSTPPPPTVQGGGGPGEEGK